MHYFLIRAILFDFVFLYSPNPTKSQDEINLKMCYICKLHCCPYKIVNIFFRRDKIQISIQLQQSYTGYMCCPFEDGVCCGENSHFCCKRHETCGDYHVRAEICDLIFYYLITDYFVCFAIFPCNIN